MYVYVCVCVCVCVCIYKHTVNTSTNAHFTMLRSSKCCRNLHMFLRPMYFGLVFFTDI